MYTLFVLFHYDKTIYVEVSFGLKLFHVGVKCN